MVAVKKCLYESEYVPTTSLREVGMMKSMRHPNVLHVHDVILESKLEETRTSHLYMIMDLALSDLRSWMKRFKGDDIIPVKSVKFITAGILSGLKYLHDDCRIIHRDLKPQNILVDYIGTDGLPVVKLADFGLARAMYNKSEERCLSTEVVTLWYRSPELLLGAHNYTFSTDIWSVGCILAELLRKKPLFYCDSEIATLHRIYSRFGTPTIESGRLDCTELTDLPYFDGKNANVRPQFSDKPLLEGSFLPRRAHGHMHDLFKGLMKMKPRCRLTATDALSHTALRQQPSDEGPGTLRRAGGKLFQ